MWYSYHSSWPGWSGSKNVGQFGPQLLDLLVRQHADARQVALLVVERHLLVRQAEPLPLVAGLRQLEQVADQFMSRGEIDGHGSNSCSSRKCPPTHCLPISSIRRPKIKPPSRIDVFSIRCRNIRTRSVTLGHMPERHAMRGAPPSTARCTESGSGPATSHPQTRRRRHEDVASNALVRMPVHPRRLVHTAGASRSQRPNHLRPPTSRKRPGKKPCWPTRATFGHPQQEQAR